MKMPKIFIIFLISFAIVQFCSAQDKPAEKRQIDAFGDAECESVLARVDNFMVEIVKESGFVGYAVIYPEKGKIKEASERQIWIQGNIAFRHFYTDRLFVIRGEEREYLQVQFWLVPAGTAKSDFNEQKWSYFTKDINKAFVFSTSWDFIVCPGNYARSFTDFLADNPHTRGHIVIFNRSGRYDRAKAESILKDFTSDGKLSRSRLKIFFAKGNGIPVTEFWVVPTRKIRATKVLQ